MAAKAMVPVEALPWHPTLSGAWPHGTTLSPHSEIFPSGGVRNAAELRVGDGCMSKARGRQTSLRREAATTFPLR